MKGTEKEDEEAAGEWEEEREMGRREQQHGAAEGQDEETEDGPHGGERESGGEWDDGVGHHGSYHDSHYHCGRSCSDHDHGHVEPCRRLTRSIIS